MKRNYLLLSALCWILLIWMVGAVNNYELSNFQLPISAALELPTNNYGSGCLGNWDTCYWHLHSYWCVIRHCSDVQANRFDIVLLIIREDWFNNPNWMDGNGLTSLEFCPGPNNIGSRNLTQSTSCPKESYFTGLKELIKYNGQLMMYRCCFFAGKCISKIPETVPGDKNRFVEINATELSFVASQSVLIGGQRRQVKKIMFYKPSWIKRNYG